MKTIHIIFNAHIDPIWLWPWQAGLDEVLATCRSACDRLDKHPDITFTRGEASVYEQVGKIDPALFARIRSHIESRRWEIVGGWWIQPDCNAPSAFGIEKQIQLGKDYFLDKFGIFPRIAYNVDSFGHAATLPALMRAAGQDRYVMMRPQEHEKELPAQIFRWQGYPNQPEVVTFRIASAYAQQFEPSLEYMQSCVIAIPEGIDHTMCYLGVGDHGGGPTERQIQWCRENRGIIDGWELKFSTPSRFFDAIEADKHRLPLVTSELQMHAVGCYSVYRPVKTGVRRAEHLLKQADLVLIQEGSNAPQTERDAVKDAWKRVCFHHFHDTLGGTCLPSAYVHVIDQLGLASSVANETLQYGLRRRMNALPDDTRQRIVLYNASDKDFADYVDFEPWLEYTSWQPGWRLIDETGASVPFQRLHSEALFMWDKHNRLLFKTLIAPGQMRVFYIDKDCAPDTLAQVWSNGDTISSDGGVVWCKDALTMSGVAIKLPRLVLIDDPSDTWSHDIDRYQETSHEAVWAAPSILDNGPLMAAVEQVGRISDTTLRAEWRVYAGETFCELLLTVHWRECHKVLKLEVDMPGNGATRTDGAMGSSLVRPNDGCEVPIRDWIIGATSGRSIGIICPDVYAADGSNNRVRLTLLRSPLMAHHHPDDGKAPRARISDQGVHDFRFRFVGGNVTEAACETMAVNLQCPPIVADLTRGMESRFD